MDITLEELKKRNAQSEADGQAAQPAVDAGEGAQAETGTGQEAPDDGGGPPGQDDAPVPLWMQADDQGSAESGQMPVRSHLSVKQKLKGRLRDKDGEIDQLRQEIQQLKSAAQPAPAPQPEQDAMPRPEDFLDATDPDAAYQLALKRWVDRGVETRLQQHLQSHQQQQQRQRMDDRTSQALDRHYDRAAAIVSDGLLSADEYQDSETLVRRAVDQVSPGNGDNYVDSLLSRLGDGSEKVVVSLARSSTNLAQLQQALREDPTGITAASFLGELKGRFTPARQVSKTPRPGTHLNGDAPNDGGADQRRYKAAHKAGNRQQAFDIKRAAKARGVDVTKW